MINSGIAISEPKKTNSPKPVKYHKMTPWFSSQLARFDNTPAIIANKSEGETLKPNQQGCCVWGRFARL
jgi:hypothetical protein